MAIGTLTAIRGAWQKSGDMQPGEIWRTIDAERGGQGGSYAHGVNAKGYEPCIINTMPVFRTELRRRTYIHITQSISEYKASGRWPLGWPPTSWNRMAAREPSSRIRLSRSPTDKPLRADTKFTPLFSISNCRMSLSKLRLGTMHF